jgi:hypothetical protein
MQNIYISFNHDFNYISRRLSELALGYKLNNQRHIINSKSSCYISVSTKHSILFPCMLVIFPFINMWLHIILNGT